MNEISQTAEPQRQGQVNSELDSLEKSAAVMQELVDRVTNRISGVLVEEPTEVLPGKEEEELVPVADRIRVVRCLLARINQTMDRLIDRVEL